MHRQDTGPRGKIFYGWVVVAASLVIMTIAYGIYFSWPVFYVAILDDFGWGRAKTAIIFSAASVTYAFSSPLSGFLFDKFGPRKLFIIAAIVIAIGVVGASRSNEIWQFCLFFGAFVGFGGIAAGFVPNAALVANWFERKRATATGISQMGTRDSFLLAPLIQIAILSLGWRASYLVLAAVAGLIIPLSLLLRTRPQDMGLLPDGEVVIKEKAATGWSQGDDRIVDKEWASIQWTLVRAIKTYQFWAFFLIMAGAGLAYASLFSHFVALVTDAGYTAMFAAGILPIYAVGSMLGRCCGFISDLIGREKAFTLSMAMMLLLLPILLFTRDTSTPWTLYIFTAGYGLGSGLYTPVYAASVADRFQGRRFGTIIGFANIGYGLGAAFGTWLFGYIFDVTGAYTWAILIVMVAVVIECVAIWLAAPRKVRRVMGRAVREAKASYV